MKLLIDVNQLLWNGRYSCYAFWHTCLLHPAFTACAAKNRIWHLPFSFRWQQKQKGIWAFWLAHNNARCYAWNRKYYRHFHRRFLRRTGCCVLVLAHRAFGHGNHLRRNVFVPPFPLSGTRWTPCIFFIFYCTKKRLHFFTVPPSRYLHFLSDAPHKATQ